MRTTHTDPRGLISNLVISMYIPLRPIVSPVKAFNHNIAMYLVNILNPLTTKEYAAKYTFTFVNELKTFNIDRTMTMTMLPLY